MLELRLSAWDSLSSLIDTIVTLFESHLSLLLGLLFSYGVLAAGVIALDSYYYSLQPKYYERMIGWWCPLSDLTPSYVNEVVIRWLIAFDEAVFGRKLISIQAVAAELVLALVAQAVFFGRTIVFSDWGSFEASLLFFGGLVGLPFIMTLLVTRICLRNAARRQNTTSTAASASALFLFVFVAGGLLLVVFTLGYFGVLMLSDRYHFSDFEITDVFALFVILGQMFVVTAIEVTLVPIYIYLGIASFAFVLTVLINVLRGRMERAVNEDKREIWNFAFRTAWVLGAVVLIVIFLTGASLVGSYQLLIRDVPTRMGLTFGKNYIESYPDWERPEVALRIRHFVEVTNAPAARSFQNSLTGWDVLARIYLGRLTVTPDPVQQYFDQINCCWLSNNIPQLYDMMNKRLDEDPDDVWALYQKACYFTFQDKNSTLAKYYAWHFFDAVDHSKVDSATKSLAYELRRKLLILAAAPQRSDYISADALHKQFVAFPGNDQGRDMWLAIHPQAAETNK